ncbi:MAG: hypothetical protein KJP18_15360, partial [Gemmatimonadetes bacterium]|nr:hypothetical protein [Gemmatimonadota bacterium]
MDLRIAPAAAGHWPLRPSLDELDEAPTGDEDDPVRFAIRSLSMLDLRIHLDSQGTTPVRSVHVDELLLTTSGRDAPIALEARGRFEGGKFDVVATLGTPAELAAPTGP